VRDGGEEEGYYGEIREEGERASKREGERDKETEESERVGGRAEVLKADKGGER